MSVFSTEPGLFGPSLKEYHLLGRGALVVHYVGKHPLFPPVSFPLPRRSV